MNPFEERSRARKVLAILATVPCGATAAEIAKTADWLGALSKFDRNVLAAAAGCKPPSDETWADVVAQARARIPVEDLPEPIDDTEVET